MTFLLYARHKLPPRRTPSRSCHAKSHLPVPWHRKHFLSTIGELTAPISSSAAGDRRLVSPAPDRKVKKVLPPCAARPSANFPRAEHPAHPHLPFEMAAKLLSA